MDINSLKNIIVLKDLPSNLVEEAIVVLKENKHVKKYQYIDSENRKPDKKANDKRNKDVIENKYIIKEAEMIVKDYLEEIEKKSLKTKNNIKKLQRKYKNSIKLNFILAFSTIVSIVISYI